VSYIKHSPANTRTNRPGLDDRASLSARVEVAYLLRELGYAAASKLDDSAIEYVVFVWLNLIVRDRAVPIRVVH
jgi:hypothetical protein